MAFVIGAHLRREVKPQFPNFYKKKPKTQAQIAAKLVKPVKPVDAAATAASFSKPQSLQEFLRFAALGQTELKRVLAHVLHCAAGRGRLEIIDYLIANHLDSVDLTANDDYALRTAAENGYLKIVQTLLLTPGSRVNALADRNYAVRLACKNGYLNVVQWLVRESGQKVDVTAGSNFCARQAALNGHIDILKWLIRESGQPIDLGGFPFIFYAIRDKQKDLLQYLICDSADDQQIAAARFGFISPPEFGVEHKALNSPIHRL